MNANLMTKKIEMSKNEAKAAGKIGTAEFEMLREYMAVQLHSRTQVFLPKIWLLPYQSPCLWA